MSQIPYPLITLVNDLAAAPGAVAVVLGGSRAFGGGDPGSDWDLGLYYRGEPGLSALSRYGTVHPPGSWGRIMNGGAWLQIGEHRVDVLLRDLDMVEHWSRRAEEGEFEVDALLGYTAGAPTYLLAAELASCRVLSGLLPTRPYPAKLAAAGPARWRFCRSFSLAYARAHARRGNVAGALGQATKAIMEEAHAILCERREWVCNEKRLIEAAGLSAVQALFTQVPTEPDALDAWINQVARHLGAPENESPPWVSAEAPATSRQA